MEALVIYYIGDKPAVVAALSAWLEQHQMRMQPYPLSEMPEVDYLLLIEPIQIGSMMYSVSKIWKNYLFVEAPATRLAVAAYGQSSHPNYLNLLDLPDHPKSYFEGLLPVGAFSPQYAGHRTFLGQKTDVYADPWERFLSMNGQDIKQDLERFIEGHDKSSSFYDTILDIRTNLVNLEYRLKGGGHLNDQEKILALKKNIYKSWNYMQLRWNYYQQYFRWLPFHHTVVQIQEKLNVLSDIILQMRKDPNGAVMPEVETLTELRVLVSEGLQKYILFTENNW
jgi:hypothetical protein